MMPEISLNILDIAQNSVKAGAGEIYIEVEENSLKGFLRVQIRDNGCGMTPEQVQRVVDPFFTSRTTRKVGLGVPFFKQAAELTGGSFSIESTVGEGTVIEAVFMTGSIDCMPMGDLDQTIVSLIQCNETLEFIYTRSIDGKSFVMDTREFRRVLEGVALNEPEVMRFIREYLQENTMQLRS